MPSRNLAVVRRASLGIAMVMVLLVGVAGFAAHSLSEVQARLQTISQYERQQLRGAIEMREHVDQVAAGVRDLVLENDVARMRPITDRIATESTAYDAVEATTGLLLADTDTPSKQANQLFAQIGADKAATWPLLTRVIALGSDNEDAAATRLFMDDAKPALERWDEALSRLAAVEDQHVQNAALEAAATWRRWLATLAALCGVALILGVAAAWAAVSAASKAS